MTVNTPEKSVNNSLVNEENFLNWKEILQKLNHTFGNDVYESWIKNIYLIHEYNHYVSTTVFCCSC